MAKPMGKGKFRSPQLRSRLVDFDEFRTFELSSEDYPPCHAKFHFDPTMWVVSANTQFGTVTEKTVSRVHVFPGSAETLVRRGGITYQYSIAYSLSNSSAKNYLNRLMWVEVVCNISVVFLDTMYR